MTDLGEEVADAGGACNDIFLSPTDRGFIPLGGNAWASHRVAEGIGNRNALGVPTPTNISIKSEPFMLRKGTLASPAVALASIVLPVPGGPKSSAPRGT
jgi:hypothetical protein